MGLMTGFCQELMKKPHCTDLIIYSVSHNKSGILFSLYPAFSPSQNLFVI